MSATQSPNVNVKCLERLKSCITWRHLTALLTFSVIFIESWEDTLTNSYTERSSRHWTEALLTVCCSQRREANTGANESKKLLIHTNYSVCLLPAEHIFQMNCFKVKPFLNLHCYNSCKLVFSWNTIFQVEGVGVVLQCTLRPFSVSYVEKEC